MNDHSTPQKSKILEFLGEYWLIILMLTLIVVACGFAYYVVTIYQNALQTVAPTTIDRGDWGTTGDFFGGVLNPIFAFLGLIMLLATLFQSQRELSLTRKELQESQKALNDQALTQKQQRFESTFFALLEQHNQLIQEINKLDLKALGISTAINTREAKDFVTYYLPNQNDIKRYFMVLYQILKMIYQNSNNGAYTKEKINNYETFCLTEELYGNLVKAFISGNAGILILFNCLTITDINHDNYPKFKALVERYGLFEHIKLFSHIDVEFLKHLIIHQEYSARAFGNNLDYQQMAYK